MLLGDLGQELRIDVSGDHSGERRVAGERFAAEQAADRMFRHELIGRIVGVDIPERRVVARAKKGEGRGEGAGADAGYDIEFRPVAACGPPDE